MVQILSGAFVLSVLHALIPNHWIPLLAVGRGERWSRGETLAVTAIAGGAHVTGTIIIGIVVGFVGIGISSAYDIIMNIVAPVILVLMGLTFIWMDMRGKHHHSHAGLELDGSDRRSRVAIIISLTSAMFLSPCLEIEAYYFSAAVLGWPAIVGVSLIYFTVTLGGMLLLVYFGLKELEKLRWSYLEHHERRVTGMVLVVLGIITYLVESP